MSYSFHAFGHKNILSAHTTTLEFTKDKHVSLNGDCIVGVGADFSLADIKKTFVKGKNSKLIEVTITADGISDAFSAEINHEFNSDHEMVFRKTAFISDRTLGVRATKAAVDLKKEIVKKLENPQTYMTVVFEYSN